MHRRDLVSFTAFAFSALTLGVGCPEDPKPTAKPATTGAAPNSTQAAAPAKPSAAPTAAAAAPTGNGTIKGVVSFTGKAPEMKVPSKRKETDFCKDKAVVYNSTIVTDGKLKDVLVRIEPGSIKGDFKAPDKHASIDQHDCMYEPRIQGVVAGQDVDIKNSDGTLHNVHTYKGTESLFNQAQPKGSDPMTKQWEDAGIIKFTCDVHPWMRGFVVVTDHPYFAVSGTDGAFTIEKIPAGKYTLEAWHTAYGMKKAEVTVADDKPAEVTFSYDGTEAAPDWNKDETKGLW